MGTVIISRGVSGSGKSTLNQALEELSEARGHSAAIHSTDDIFEQDGKFDPAKLGINHAKNLENFKASLEAGIDTVVCDNTNTSHWEYEKYLKAAREAGYAVQAVVFEPGPIDVHEKRNTHNVPRDVLVKQKENLLNNLKSIGVDKEYNVEQQSMFNFIERIRNLASHLVPEPSNRSI